MGLMPGKHGKLPKARADGLSMWISTDAPLARSANLVIEEIDDELLVYDLDRHRAHCLSATAAKVWRRCDGETPIAGLGAALGLDEDTIDRTVEELVGCELLNTNSEPTSHSTSGSNGSTRRQMMVRAAKTGAAVATVPLIVSVAAPLPAQAVTLNFCRSSCGGGPTGCTGSGCGDCCKPEFEGCCCCDPGDGFTKDCVPADCGDVTCKALRGSGAHCSCGAAKGCP